MPHEFSMTLSEKEQQALDHLAQSTDLSPQRVMLQALRLYQLHHTRMADGETLHYSGDAERALRVLKPVGEPEPDPVAHKAHEVLQELGRRLFVEENPGEVWVHQKGTVREQWIERARERVGSTLVDANPDVRLARRAFLDGATAMAESVRSLQLHVSMGPKATFDDGMRTMQQAVNGVADATLAALRGAKE